MRGLTLRLGSLRDKYFLHLIASIVAISGLLFGFDVGIISGAIVFINKEYNLSSFGSGLVVSSILFAAFFGALCSGRLADYFGRRKLLIVTAVMFVTGTALVSSSANFYELIIGRIVIGIAIGISSFVTPLYVAEISPAQKRGVVVGLYQLFVTFGVLVAYFISYVLYSSANWHTMFEVGFIPALLFFFGVLVIPESPRWAMLHGNENLARNILSRVRNYELVELELLEIRNSLRGARNEWKMLLRPWILPAVFLGVGLIIFRQLTGISSIIYYIPSIFEIIGFQHFTKVLSGTVVIGILNVIFTIISIKLVDKWGRRPLLLMSLAGMFVSMLVLALSFEFSADAFNGWQVWIGFLSYVSFFALGLGTLTLLMVSEIFPLRVRGIAVGLALAINWGLNGLATLAFLPLTEVMGLNGVFWMYAGFCLLGLLFVNFAVPETKGVSLEQIEVNLRTGKGSRNIGIEEY